MAHAKADAIRNVALVGHRGSGKTSLNEALLFQAGATNRLGTVADGTTVSDSAADEKARGMSIAASLGSFDWRACKVNLIDTPGEPSFVADALCALRVCESAVFVVNGVMGVEVATQRLWDRADELGLARLVFVNMLDRERADFFRALDSLKGAFGPHVVATEIPIGAEHELRGVVDLIDMKAYEYEGTGRDNCTEIDDPGRPAPARRGVPREADGRGGRGLGRADGALPGGRGDLARGDGRRARERRQRGSHLSGDVRRGDPEPRHQPVARRLLRGPSLAGRARRRDRWGGRARAGGGSRRGGARVQDARRSVRRTHQPVPRLPGRGEPRLARVQHPRARQGADRAAARAAGQGDGPRRRVRPGRHRGGREAEGDPRRRRARRPRRRHPARAPRAPRAGHGVRDRATREGRRGQGVHGASPAPGGGSDDRPPP